MKADSKIWIRLMLLAFLANGLGPFGLKVLDEAGLSDWFQQYLLYWYSGGLIFAAAAFLGSKAAREFPETPASPKTPPARRLFLPAEILLGAGMGLASLSGQAFTGLALASKAPGHIVFPLTTGGSLFLVAAAGVLLFRERVGKYGVAGIAVGILALVILSVSEGAS
jgi:drug/metabolite transporter (DMT)-like permease